MGATVRLAMVQQAYEPFARDANLAKAEHAVRDAAARGADIVCLPEMFLTGYPMYRAEDGKLRRMAHVEIEGFAALDENSPHWMDFARRMRETAEPADGPYAARLATLARELSVCLVAGVCEAGDGEIYNSAFVYGPDGRHVRTYRKVHAAFWWPGEYLCARGDRWEVLPVEIAGQTIRLGVMICCDREYPEAARILMLQRAEIVLVPNGGGINDMRLMQIRVRAFENAFVVGMANQADGYGGRSMIVDARGTVAAEADASEQTIVADIDLDATRQVQRACLWTDRFRRPDTYGALCAAPDTPIH